jgi:hypothetical protein
MTIAFNYHGLQRSATLSQKLRIFELNRCCEYLEFDTRGRIKSLEKTFQSGHAALFYLQSTNFEEPTFAIMALPIR